MKPIARSFVWWPKNDKDKEDLCYSCSRCQKHSNNAENCSSASLGLAKKHAHRLCWTEFEWLIFHPSECVKISGWSNKTPVPTAVTKVPTSIEWRYLDL